MKISDIINSITNKYFDYGNKRYYIDKIVSHDLKIEMHIKDLRHSSYLGYAYEIIFSFKLIFENDELNITSSKYVSKYMDECEDKKFLFFHYKKRKINPICKYLDENLFFLGYNYQKELLEGKIASSESYLDYFSKKLDCIENYLYVKTWVEKILSIYEEIYSK